MNLFMKTGLIMLLVLTWESAQADKLADLQAEMDELTEYVMDLAQQAIDLGEDITALKRENAALKTELSQQIVDARNRAINAQGTANDARYRANNAQSTANTAVSKVNSIKFECVSGSGVLGKASKWSPYATCPNGYIVVALARIDLHGNEYDNNSNVNDFICNHNGCEAWCVDFECTVVSRCCRVVHK